MSRGIWGVSDIFPLLAALAYFRYGYTMRAAIEKQVSAIRDIILNTVPVEQIYLFGSHAYGTPSEESDLDFLVVMKDGARLGELDAESLLSNAVRSARSVPADILVIKKSDFEYRRAAATLEREVAEKGMALCG